MAFPLSPINGQTATINNIVYVYSSTTNTWTRTAPGFGNIGASGNISAIGTISAAGNVYGNYIIGNVTNAVNVTGNAQPNITSVGTLSSLTSNGLVSTTGNISGNYILGNGSQITSVVANTINTTFNGTANTYYLDFVAADGANNQTVYNSPFLNYVPTSGLLGVSALTATGNISGNYIIGNGSQLTGLPASYGNANVAAYLPTYTGNLTAGNISATGNIGALGTISATGTAVTGVNAAQFGVPNVALHAYSVITSGGNANQSSQFAFQNFSNGSNASTDIALYNNLGTDSTYFIDMGIVSSTYNGAAAGANAFSPNDGYLYVVGNSATGPIGTGANIGNLILGTTNGQILAWVGNTSTSNIVTVTSNTGFAVTGNISATGLVTGGTVSTTGVVYGGNIVANGNINSGNLLATGVMSSTGNSYQGNALVTGLISATGNVTGNSLITGGGIFWANGLPYASGNVSLLNPLYNDLQPLSGSYSWTPAPGSNNGYATVGVSDYYGNSSSFVNITSTGSYANSRQAQKFTSGASSYAAAGLISANSIALLASANSGGFTYEGIFSFTSVTGNVTGTMGFAGMANTTSVFYGNLTASNFTGIGVGWDSSDNVNTGHLSLYTSNGVSVTKVTQSVSPVISVSHSYYLVIDNEVSANTISVSMMDLDTDVMIWNNYVVPSSYVSANVGLTAGMGVGTLGTTTAMTFTGLGLTAYPKIPTITTQQLGNISSIGTNSISTITLAASGNINASGNIIQTGTGNINGYNGYFSNNFTVVGTFQSTSNITANGAGIFYGNNVTGNSALYAGVPGYTPLGSNVVLQVAGNANSYSQINFQNINPGTQATTEIIVTANNGNDVAYFGDFGIAGNNYSNTSPYNDLGTAVAPNDTYLYSQGNSNGGGGNLAIGSNEKNGVVRIFANGSNTANIVSTFANGGMTTVGYVSASGNVTGNYIFGNGAFLTGISGGGNGGGNGTAILNGTSNVNIATANGNITVGVSGVGNVVTWAPTGEYVSGVISATGNITGGNIVTGTGTGGNLTGANVISANTFIATATISAIGNIQGSYILGNGALLTGVSTSSSNINNGTSNVTVTAANANITVGVAGTANVIQWATTGEYVTGLISASGNITGGNLRTAGLVTATGNITGGNITTAGLVTATGNITGGNILFGTGIVSGTGNIFGGNLTISGAGNIAAANVNLSNTLSAGGNVVTPNTVSGGTITATGNIFDGIGPVRNIPINSQAANYTLALTDNGKFVSTTSNVFVPNTIFSAGNAITLFNNSAANVTVYANTSVTMYLAGTATTGNRTLAQRGMATILCVAANTFVISGAGLF